MKRWMFVFPGLLLSGLAVLLRDSEAFVAVGVIGAAVCMALGGFSTLGVSDNGD